MPNAINYQRELDKMIERNLSEGIRPRLLVHSCCAPCSSYVMEYLSRYFDLTMYFYNPNMNSREEYDKRASELKRLIGELNQRAEEQRSGGAAADGTPLPSKIGLIIEDYDPESFEKIASGHESDPERGPRCRLCYELRLRKTAAFMQDYNHRAVQDPSADSRPFDYFATTLTLSPLKDAEALNEIASQLAVQYQVRALLTDFKKKNGYKRSIELSREYGLYRQDYCGCRFSKQAREAAFRAGSM